MCSIAPLPHERKRAQTYCLTSTTLNILFWHLRSKKWHSRRFIFRHWTNRFSSTKINYLLPFMFSVMSRNSCNPLVQIRKLYCWCGTLCMQWRGGGRWNFLWLCQVIKLCYITGSNLTQRKMEEKRFGTVSSTNLDSNLICGHKHCDTDNWIHGHLLSSGCVSGGGGTRKRKGAEDSVCGVNSNQLTWGNACCTFIYTFFFCTRLSLWWWQEMFVVTFLLLFAVKATNRIPLYLHGGISPE